MCSGVEYELDGRRAKVYFPNPKAQLPVRRQGGGGVMVPWGARGREPALDSRLGGRPTWIAGGWARYESIQQGAWDDYKPVPARIQVLAFMEKDADEASHWFDLEPDQYIQGLLAHLGGERRIYVVTVPAPPEYARIHDRWPRLVTGSKM